MRLFKKKTTEQNTDHRKTPDDNICTQDAAGNLSLGLLAAAAACWECCILYLSGRMTDFPWIVPGAAVLILLVILGDRMRGKSQEDHQDGEKKRRILMGAVIGLILLLGGVLHSQIADGFGAYANNIFAQSEESQAYIYDRFEVTMDVSAQWQAQHLFTAWASMLLGALLALLPASWRRWSGPAFFVILAAGLAYFGLVPPMIPMGLLLMILLLQGCGGNIKTALPLLAAAAIVFVAVCVIDPGENSAVSRADEQLRDRLALSTVSLEGQQSLQEELQQQQNEGAGGGEKDTEQEPEPGSRKFQIVLGLSLLILAVLLIPAIIRDRLERKRKKNRRGIDSEDPAEAIRAIFPYAIRWLSLCGIQPGNRPFRTLGSNVSETISASYGESYRRMASLWEKAAYSDRPVTEEHREEMMKFLQETKSIVDKKCGWRGRIRTRLQMAL